MTAEQKARQWASPQTKAIGFAGSAFGFLALDQSDLTYELYSLYLYRHLPPDQLPIFDGPGWVYSFWFLLIPLAFAFLAFALGVFGSSKQKGYPVYFVALLVTLTVATAGVCLAPVLSYLLNNYLIELHARQIVGDAAFLGFLLLTIAIACGQKRDRLPQILVGFGAATAGVSLGYLQTIHPFGQNIYLWTQAIIMLPLLFSLILFYQQRGNYQLHAPTPMTAFAFIRNLGNSSIIWKILAVKFLVETAYLSSQTMPPGTSGFAYYTAVWFLLALALIALGSSHPQYSPSTRKLLLRLTQISFAFILSWTATRHFGFQSVSEWFGLFGNVGLYVVSLAVLAWYILTIENSNRTSGKPDYPKFLLILLIVEGAPRALLLFAFDLMGADADTPINEIVELIGFLATALLLLTVLVWTRKTPTPKRAAER